jgi:hypothetical protein
LSGSQHQHGQPCRISTPTHTWLHDQPPLYNSVCALASEKETAIDSLTYVITPWRSVRLSLCRVCHHMAVG